jgi:asparagine synthase (glutamine-hydrolysing)
MMRRYLLLLGEDAAALYGRARVAAETTGFKVALAGEGIAVLTSANCRCLETLGGAAIVGTLFRRHGAARPLDRLDEQDQRALHGRGEAALLRSFWGGYVAALPAARGFTVLRDPSGALPCYCAGGAGVVGFASDAGLLIEAKLARPAIDWDALGRHFLSGGVPAAATALSGIFELLPGFALDLPGPLATQRPCWSPWDHVSPIAPETMAERLARSVRQSVRSWAAAHGRLLVSVSGGLDSSIVAACLAEAGADAICLTMFGEDPTGDERIYARAVCGKLGLRLLERPDRLEDVDIALAIAPHLPRPFGRSQALSYEKNHIEVAGAVGADAFMTGNGGDSVLGHSQSAAAIVDRLLAEGLGGGALRTFADVCRQTGCSAFAALASALRLLWAPRQYRVRPDTSFLDSGLVAAAAPPAHPWLEAPPGALPGKAAHIAGILRVQHCMEPGRSTLLPVLNPLMAQPVLETCLAIPTWAWRAGGRDRAVARDAFVGPLPETILRRRVKSGPDAFAGQILERKRDAVRERLLDGQLARQGIVDADALAAALGGGAIALEDRVRLLELVSAEAWVDAWSEGSAARACGGDSR